MESIFKNNSFYPQNFFMTANEDTDIEGILKHISEKACDISPDSFDAEVKHFIYKLSYQPPYVSIAEFKEIKNLQVEARSKIHYKDEYNGYIGIDISEWVGHSHEEHFINCILALRTKSRHWKYVFFADADLNAADIRKTLEAIKEKLWVKELQAESIPVCRFSDRLSEEMEKKHNVKLSSSGKKIINDIFEEGAEISNEAVSDIASDMAMYFSDTPVIHSSQIMDYLSDDTYAHFVMSEKAISRLEDISREREAKR